MADTASLLRAAGGAARSRCRPGTGSTPATGRAPGATSCGCSTASTAAPGSGGRSGSATAVTASTWAGPRSAPRGVIYSLGAPWHPVHRALGDACPYTILLVELPEAGGIRMVGNLVGDPLQPFAIGDPVEAVFEDHDDAETPFTLVQWGSLPDRWPVASGGLTRPASAHSAGRRLVAGSTAGLPCALRRSPARHHPASSRLPPPTTGRGGIGDGQRRRLPHARGHPRALAERLSDPAGGPREVGRGAGMMPMRAGSVVERSAVVSQHRVLAAPSSELDTAPTETLPPADGGRAGPTRAQADLGSLRPVPGGGGRPRAGRLGGAAAVAPLGVVAGRGPERGHRPPAAQRDPRCAAHRRRPAALLPDPARLDGPSSAARRSPCGPCRSCSRWPPWS